MLCHVIAALNFTIGYDAMSKGTHAFCGSTQPTNSGCASLLLVFPLFCSTLFPNLTLRLLMSYIYMYIYGISSLRVNDLTLNLLTWRKW